MKRKASSSRRHRHAVPACVNRVLLHLSDSVSSLVPAFGPAWVPPPDSILVDALGRFCYLGNTRPAFSEYVRRKQFTGEERPWRWNPGQCR